jgi:cytochrome b561
MTVFIFTVLSFAFAVRATGLEHKEHFKGVQHRTTGLFIMILVFLQVMMGICRPHLPHKPEQEEVSLEEDGFGRTDEPAKEELVPKKSIQRILWETLHRLLGFTLLGFAWWQVGNGLGLYSEYFSEKNLANVFWGITGTLSAITLVVYFLLFIGCA